jgi:hypothetical protein
MRCFYINFYTDGVYYYYDLIINNGDDQLYIRLNSIGFSNEPNEDELVSFCLERVKALDETLIVDKIYLKNADTCIYTNG